MSVCLNTSKQGRHLGKGGGILLSPCQRKRNIDANTCDVSLRFGPQSVSVLVPVQQAQVPLLKGDAVDHHEIVQAVLSCGCSSRDPPRLRD